MLVGLSLPENNPVDYARGGVGGFPSHSEPLILVEGQEDGGGERSLAGISMSLTAKMVAGEQAGGTS